MDKLIADLIESLRRMVANHRVATSLESREALKLCIDRLRSVLTENGIRIPEDLDS